ncbi:olfactory receptor 2AK2-like [Elephas maximus indicus]|uniref:olfactory receptor 2AK2-like n=1 Tax=Elephas maximus indicus TaxID=99487 RepID=UPI002116554F|nr:olfactory receptor 2AK2-like [Elephas maximus indicus]
MKTENQTFGTEFILLGFFQYGQMNTVLFVTIVGLFSVTLMGNIILIHLIRLDTPLHTPMYFLLSQLSFIDMMYISTTVPKMAANFLSNTMKTENQTFGAEFILLGLFQYGQMNKIFFVAITVIFSVALMGNIILIHLMRLDTLLHTPMYFLLSQLSFIDMMYISTTVPKMATNFLSNNCMQVHICRAHQSLKYMVACPVASFKFQI